MHCTHNTLEKFFFFPLNLMFMAYSLWQSEIQFSQLMRNFDAWSKNKFYNTEIVQCPKHSMHGWGSCEWLYRWRGGPQAAALLRCEWVCFYGSGVSNPRVDSMWGSGQRRSTRRDSVWKVGSFNAMWVRKEDTLVVELHPDEITGCVG